MTSVLSIKRTSIGLLAAGLVAFAALPATAGATQVSAARTTKPAPQTITQLVVNNPNFDVLEAAVIDAGLAGVLDGTTQYTVFAPTDKGFIKTLGVTTEAEAIAAVQGLPNDVLTDILLYHVTEGKRSSLSVLLNRSYPMLNGDRLTRLEVLKSGLIATDIQAKNGTVHVISSVLMPR
jgi:uncharacterized surface protein with fasciclin (FAS1) repeats